MTSLNVLVYNTKQILLNNLISKHGLVMKFSQFKKYYKRKIFIKKKIFEKYDLETSSMAFLIFKESSLKMKRSACYEQILMVLLLHI